MSRTNPIDLEAFGMERQSWGTNFAAFRRMGPFLRAYLEYFEPIYSNISISSIEPNRIGSFWSGTEKLGDQFRRMGPFLRDYLTLEKSWGTNLRGTTRKYPAKKGFLGVRNSRLISFERPSNELKVNFVRGPRDTQKSSKSDGFYR